MQRSCVNYVTAYFIFRIIRMIICYYFVIVILAKELVGVTSDQCNEYEFQPPFYPGSSCEDIYNKNPQSQVRSGYYFITDGPSRVYCGMTYIGPSCENIYYENPETRDKSGYYRINDTQWMYCNMTALAVGEYFIPQCGGGVWKKITHINISAGDNCPGMWIKSAASGLSFCRVAVDSSYTCSSAYFSTNGTSYQRVCGRAKGYQKGYPWGFYGRDGAETIDGVYAAGLSITHGNPRQHIWTFVAGYSETANDACPCAGGRWPSPEFVGNNYYCESGTETTSPSGDTYFLNDPLWDGTGCSAQSNCCDNPKQPWFNHQLDQPTQDSIEARICSYGPFGTRSTVIDQLEVYIQ